MERLVADAGFEIKDIMAPPKFRITHLPEGMGFGEGSISGAEIDPRSQRLLEETISEDSPEILSAVEAEDDGCSDGRRAIHFFTKERVLKRSLVRAKVFGGAVTMATAARIGLGEVHGTDLQSAFEDSLGVLKSKGIKYGAHTGEHSQDEDCGCGAIDRSPEALNAAIRYEDRIRSVIALLGIPANHIDDVFGNYRRYWTDTMSKQTPYKGSDVMEKIVDSNAVVKELGGEHRERRIILNNVRGFSVNQELIRLVTGDRAQVFAVDVWRLQDIAAQLYPVSEADQQKAVLSELIYTLGTAVVLTKGDLPIDIIEPLAG